MSADKLPPHPAPDTSPPAPIRVVIPPPPVAEIISVCGDANDLDSPHNQALLHALLHDDAEEEQQV